MAGVNVSAETIKAQISELKQAAEQVSAARRSIDQQYRQVTAQWKDAKARELGAVVNESSGALLNIEKVLLQGQKSLADLLAAVNAYEQQNMSSVGGVSSSYSVGGGQNVGTGGGGAFDNSYIANLAVANGLVAYADFGGLDPRTARDIYTRIAQTKERFPRLELGFVGSAQARNNHIKNQLTNMYLEAYRSYYPNASDEQLMRAINDLVDEDMRGLAIGDNTLAQSLYVGEPNNYGEEIMSWFNGISVNERFGGNYEYFSTVSRDDVAALWHPEGCDTPVATVDHEIGHQLARLTDAHNDSCIQELYADFMDLGYRGSSEALSGYARDNIHEFIAESWAEYCNNPNCRPVAADVAGRLIEMYDGGALRRVLVRR